MAESQRLGGKVRAVRKSHRLTQVRLAEQLGISPSYLNLIEHNRRPLTAQLLLKLVKLFDLDLATFASDDTDQVEHELMEVFGDELFDDQRLTRGDVEELVEHHPNVARSIRRLYDAWQSAQEQARTLAGEDGEVARNGTFQKTVSMTTTYTLECVGEGDDNEASADVTVTVGDTVQIVSLDVDKAVVAPGDDV